MSRDDLKNQAQSVQSLAVEADRLAADIASGDTTTPYAETRASELADNAQSLQQDLQQPAESSVQGQEQTLARDCGALSRDLQQLDNSPDESGAHRVKPDLDRLAKQVTHEVGQL